MDRNLANHHHKMVVLMVAAVALGMVAVVNWIGFGQPAA